MCLFSAALTAQKNTKSSEEHSSAVTCRCHGPGPVKTTFPTAPLCFTELKICKWDCRKSALLPWFPGETFLKRVFILGANSIRTAAHSCSDGSVRVELTQEDGLDEKTRLPLLLVHVHTHTHTGNSAFTLALLKKERTPLIKSINHSGGVGPWVHPLVALSNQSSGPPPLPLMSPRWM